MDQTTVERIAALLEKAARVHHDVFRSTDGADDDWATWYAWWLSQHTELPDLVGAKVVPSELTWMLVGLDKEYRQRADDVDNDKDWAHYFAEELLRHFSR